MDGEGGGPGAGEWGWGCAQNPPCQVSSLTRICSCPFLHESGESSLSSARHTPIWHFTTSWTWGQWVPAGLRPPQGPWPQLAVPPTQAPRQFGRTEAHPAQGKLRGAGGQEARDKAAPGSQLPHPGLPSWRPGRALHPVCLSAHGEKRACWPGKAGAKGQERPSPPLGAGSSARP